MLLGCASGGAHISIDNQKSKIDNRTVLSPLAQRLLAHIRKRELMRAGDRVAVAVSGGADSVALLRLMLELRGELGVVVSVAHFNHKIRRQASDNDEAFVRDLATQHGLESHRDEADVPAHAREHKMSLEAAARDLRYNFFFGLQNTEKVATAHTIDDQAETVLMRMIRGTGNTGLVGIRERMLKGYEQSEFEKSHPILWTRTSNVEIVRPLLRTRRSDIEDYLRSVDQPWRDDATNADLHHTRNRIRHLVIPLIEREFNPAVRESLADAADIAAAEEESWYRYMPFFGEEMVDRKARVPGGTALANRFFARQPLGMRRRLVRYVCEMRGFTLSFDEVERVLSVMKHGGATQLAGGWVVERDRCRTVIRPKSELVSDMYLAGVRVDGTTTYPITELGICIDVTHNRSNDPAALEACAPTPFPGPLILRPWRAGDRFWPQHSSGPKKVKELLTDKHISGAERKIWPVIACGDDIVWLRGFGVSQAYVAAAGATNGIVITEEPLERQ